MQDKVFTTGMLFQLYKHFARSLLLESTVGHLLPEEMSRLTRYITYYGVTVTVKIVSTTLHRRSPLVQGGLVSPVMVRVQMDIVTQRKHYQGTATWCVRATNL